jgi:Mg2+ and Co2+ transporter CorA
MNYIRYWQASGESIKTSLRTKTRLGQIVQEGRFRGGSAPYGYRLEKQGRRNKKNHELYEIMVDKIEAQVVRKIFDLYLNRGYGSLRICRYLEEQGIRNRKGNNWNNATIQHMLKNNAYTGVLKSGETVSEPFPALQIIDEQTYSATQELLAKRSADNKERTVPLNTRGNTLLSGNVFCGHCGARLTVTTNGKKHIQRGDEGTVITPKMRYVCYNKTRHPHLCDGQTGYTSSKLDSMVEQIAKHIFEQIKECPEDDLIEARYTEHLDECKANLVRANQELKENSDVLAEYEAEVINSLRGKSQFSPDLLNKLHAEAAERTKQAKQRVTLCESELSGSEKRLVELRHEYSSLLSWAGIFDISSIEAKKMILTHIINVIRVKRDYELDIELHISCEQFIIAESASSKMK